MRERGGSVQYPCFPGFVNMGAGLPLLSSKSAFDSTFSSKAFFTLLSHKAWGATCAISGHGHGGWLNPPPSFDDHTFFPQKKGVLTMAHMSRGQCSVCPKLTSIIPNPASVCMTIPINPAQLGLFLIDQWFSGLYWPLPHCPERTKPRHGEASSPRWRASARCRPGRCSPPAPSPPPRPPRPNPRPRETGGAARGPGDGPMKPLGSNPRWRGMKVCMHIWSPI